MVLLQVLRPAELEREIVRTLQRLVLFLVLQIEVSALGGQCIANVRPCLKMRDVRSSFTQVHRPV